MSQESERSKIIKLLWLATSYIKEERIFMLLTFASRERFHFNLFSSYCCCIRLVGQWTGILLSSPALERKYYHIKLSFIKPSTNKRRRWDFLFLRCCGCCAKKKQKIKNRKQKTKKSSKRIKDQNCAMIFKSPITWFLMKFAFLSLSLRLSSSSSFTNFYYSLAAQPKSIAFIQISTLFFSLSSRLLPQFCEKIKSST